MLEKHDIITVRIPESAYPVLAGMAARYPVGGRSHIHDSVTRAERIGSDAVTGILGTYALHVYWYGEVEGLDRMVIQRQHQDMQPYTGDGGCDLNGKSVDCKASAIRHPQRPIRAYHLIVRPKERHPLWTYVCALVRGTFDSGGVTVFLLGWTTDSRLPAEPDDTGVFKGAYTMPVPDLFPLPPIRAVS